MDTFTHPQNQSSTAAPPAPTPSASPFVEQLHPNLARLAAVYDQIVESFTRKEIDDLEARSRIRRLRARDDQGVIWSLREDGQWYRQTRDGQLIPDTPPTSGIPGVSPFDMSSNNYRSENPDMHISKPDASSIPPDGAYAYNVDNARVTDSDKITRRFMNWKYRRVALFVAALSVAGVLLGYGVMASSNDSLTPQNPSDSTPVVIVEN